MTTWSDILAEEKKKPYFLSAYRFQKKERAKGVSVFPLEPDIFRAFEYCAFEDLKVVLLGQDPYHSLSKVGTDLIPTAHGLCFSVVRGAKVPPSLGNIYKQIQGEYGENVFSIPSHGDLSSWARQGVLLLNTTLTVQAHKPMSHVGKGWELFTDSVIRKISEQKENVVFLLWGRHAQEKRNLIDETKHIIFSSAHPSPFSAHKGFLGNGHFSQTNKFLVSCGKDPIDWASVCENE